MSGELKITKSLLDKLLNVHSKSEGLYSDVEAVHKHNKEEDLTERRNKALNNMNNNAMNGTNDTNSINTTATTTTNSNNTKMKG